MFKTNDFLFTAETTPDVTTNLADSVAKVQALVSVADAVNVTDSPNCKSRLNSLLVASEIKKTGLDVILQLTGRDRNQVALESILLGALSTTPQTTSQTDFANSIASSVDFSLEMFFILISL